MTLIKSISGIRGTIGNKPGDNLTPIEIVKFTSSFTKWVIDNSKSEKKKIVVGRDARISGKMIEQIIVSTINSLGVDVINIGLATTPTTEIAVMTEKADGGIIITASHNPKQWNALKLLNSKGEFLSAKDGEKVLELADNIDFNYAEVDNLGKEFKKDYTDIHIEQILKLKLVNIENIKKANFKVVIDCVNSVGGIAIPKLLKALGINNIVELYCEPNGHFPHNPEPLPEHLTEISSKIQDVGADVGFVVDPDVDRLAIVNEDGSMFGEEYTIVSIADYILKSNKGNTVSNLSSSRALRDVTHVHNCEYFASAVGEVNVVEMMKEKNAIFGGEGNGGVIYPEYHYGRDALVGIALFLSYLAETGLRVSELRKKYPEYVMSKNKIELTPDINVDKILQSIAEKFKNEKVNTIDGVKIDFEEGWVHLRKSNTEPIIRIYSEAKSKEEAENFANKIKEEILKL